MIEPLLDLLVQIQQIPSPTFAETRRAQFVLERFRAEGFSDPQMDSAGNVLARIPGQSADRPLVVSAHLDTVFPLETNLSVHRSAERIYGPGIGDNSLGVAGLFGLAWWLRERKLTPQQDIWLVANTCEEGLGDLVGMKAVCDRFGPTAKAYLVLEGVALGRIYNCGVGALRYKITCHTHGGHSWSDFGKPSAIHELSGLVTRISSLHLPRSPVTTYNVGRIGGGTSVNTLAASAWMELDLRSESESALQHLVHQVETLVESANKTGVRFETHLIGQRPAGELRADHPLIHLAQNCLRQQGLSSLLTAGSTDANIPLSQGYPALVLGLTFGENIHTLEESIEIEPIARGVEQLGNFVSCV